MASEFLRHRRFLVFAETRCIFCNAWGCFIFPNTFDGFLECVHCRKMGADPIAYWNREDYSIHGEPAMFALAEIEGRVKEANALTRRERLEVVR
jgi:hypothetical protein